MAPPQLSPRDPPELDLVDAARSAVAASERYLGNVRRAMELRMEIDGRLDPVQAHRQQRLLHGFAWIATTVHALRATLHWAERLCRLGRFAEAEQALLRIGFGEYLGQLAGGVPMSQNEIVRPADFGLAEEAIRLARESGYFLEDSAGADHRSGLIAHLREGGHIDETLDDDTMDLVRNQFRRFAEANVAPHAHRWHLADSLIPMEVVRARRSGRLRHLH
jgi:(2S)-methylsuccinyl-CoA dehydrogenase